MKPIVLLLTCAIMVTGAPTAAVLAQEAPKPAPKTYDMRDGTAGEMAVWINNPNVHTFYQMTVEAFAQGPDHLDRAAYDKRAREIIHDLAVSMHVPPEAMQDHLKAIPGELVQIVTRDPHALDSYDNFIVALFGPQKWPG